MATIQSVSVPTSISVVRNERWANLAQNDDGSPTPFAQYTDRSVQVVGTFGGATVVFEGSNNGTTWATLTDTEGNPLVLSSPAVKQVTEICLFARPRVAGGDGTTSLTVNLCMRT